MSGLCVVDESDGHAVIDKPAGLRSVPGRGPDAADSVETRARARWSRAEGPIVVHRLDIETSGLMVIALTRVAHRALSRQFMNRKVGKTYAAVLGGLLGEDEGAVDLPLVVDWPNRPRQKVCAVDGRPARTLWRVVERTASTTRVEFRPLTGRTHQLRVHAATPRAAGGLGCPILGDTLYGDPDSPPRLMLHADFLAFWAPETHAWTKHRRPAPF